MVETATKTKKKSEILVSKEYCTGCGMCVNVCPADVLELTETLSKVSGVIAGVKNLSACTQCMLCEVHCPDFAIVVKKIV